MINPDNMIDPYIKCGKLKTAYLKAVSNSNIKKIKLIQEIAKKEGLQKEYELCTRFLEHYQRETSLS